MEKQNSLLSNLKGVRERPFFDPMYRLTSTSPLIFLIMTLRVEAPFIQLLAQPPQLVTIDGVLVDTLKHMEKDVTVSYNRHRHQNNKRKKKFYTIRLVVIVLTESKIFQRTIKFKSYDLSETYLIPCWGSSLPDSLRRHNVSKNPLRLRIISDP